MVPLILCYLFYINFQIILATRGITMPLNTVTAKIESYKAQPRKEDALKIENTFGINEVNNLKDVKNPTLTNIIPNMENNYGLSQIYGEECALKYNHYNKIYVPPMDHETVLNSAVLKPIMPETFYSMKESMNPIGNYIPPPLKLPLTVSSSVTSLDSSFNSPSTFKSDKIDVSMSYPSYDSSNNDPLPPPCAFTYSETSKLALELAKSIEASKSQFLSSLPLSGLSTVNMLPNIGPSNPWSALTLPISLTSTTNYLIPHSPGFSSLQITSFPASANTLQSPFTTSQMYNKDNLLSPTVPQPLLPFPQESQECIPNLPVASSVCSHPIKITSSVIHYSYPTMINAEFSTNAKCPIVPKYTQTLPLTPAYDIYEPLNLIASASFDKSASSLYRNCYTLKPLPSCNKIPPLNTLPLSLLPSSPNIASQGGDISQNNFPEFNCFQSLPHNLPTPVVPVFENKLLSPFMTLSSEYESTYTSKLPSNSLLFPTSSTLNCFPSLASISQPICSSTLNCLPSIPSPVLPNSSATTNGLPSIQNLPISSSTSNSFPSANDISPSPLMITESDFRTFKRSPDSSKTVQVPLFNSVEINVIPSSQERGMNIVSSITDKKSVEKVLQLISLAEILNNEDKCDDATIKDILFILNGVE